MELNYFHRDIEVFFRSLEKETRAKVARLTRLLSEKEYHLSMPFSKKLEKDLYELRSNGSQNVRIFYTFHNGGVVLLYAICKKTQKLSKKDIETARHRLAGLQNI